jgi:hypothetical protein
LASNQLGTKLLAATFSTQTSAILWLLLRFWYKFFGMLMFGMPQFWQGTFGSQPIRPSKRCFQNLWFLVCFHLT